MKSVQGSKTGPKCSPASSFTPSASCQGSCIAMSTKIPTCSNALSRYSPTLMEICRARGCCSPSLVKEAVNRTSSSLRDRSNFWSFSKRASFYHKMSTICSSCRKTFHFSWPESTKSKFSIWFTIWRLRRFYLWCRREDWARVQMETSAIELKWRRWQRNCNFKRKHTGKSARMPLQMIKGPQTKLRQKAKKKSKMTEISTSPIPYFCTRLMTANSLKWTIRTRLTNWCSGRIRFARWTIHRHCCFSPTTSIVVITCISKPLEIITIEQKQAAWC